MRPQPNCRHGGDNHNDGHCVLCHSAPILIAPCRLVLLFISEMVQQEKTAGTTKAKGGKRTEEEECPFFESCRPAHILSFAILCYSYRVPSNHTHTHTHTYTRRGYIGVASCICLSNFGSAWGTWRAGLGICSMGINYSKGIMKNIIPVVMAGVLGIYGLIVSVIIAQAINEPKGMKNTTYSTYNAWCHVSITHSTLHRFQSRTCHDAVSKVLSLAMLVFHAYLSISVSIFFSH